MTDEFDRQVETLLRKGYPPTAGVTEAAFLDHVAPLRARAAELAAGEAAIGAGRVPFVVVVRSQLVPADRALALVTLRDRRGFTSLESADIERFRPTEDVALPGGLAYLLVDVDAGRETLNVTPDDALPIIQRAGRTPLTIDEGIALITHYPDILKRSNCFSLLGSRCGDRRVPALWLSQGRPRLGWCWAGNPHTWLGSASGGGRVGPGLSAQAPAGIVLTAAERGNAALPIRS